MSVTLKTLEENQAALIKQFGPNDVCAYPNVRMGQLSMARYYGGCKIGGKHFVYNAVDDSLIREDVVKWLTKRLKVEAKSASIKQQAGARPERPDAQLSL